MKNFSMLVLSILFFSCQQKENKIAPVSTSDSITTNITKKEVKENKQLGDTIYMEFKNEKGSFIAEGVIDSIHPRVYVKFKNEDSGNLKANIVPTTGKGNIRFNQLISPDSASDGPFGMDLNIPLKQKGNYIIVIGHSQMADSPFWGNFRVEMEIKKE